MIKKFFIKPVIFGIVLFFIGCSHNQKQAPKPVKASVDSFFDASASEKQASYLYAPGLMASEILMGRYCPSFTAVSGEKITWRSAGHVIGQPHSAVVFPEVDLKKPNYTSLNPITAIINSVRRDLNPLIQRVFKDTYSFSVEPNPSSPLTVEGYFFNFGQANIAQSKDLRAMRKTYRKHVEQYPESDVILYGDSRGAATIFNFIALEKPTQVKAAVLEGGFDSVAHLIKHFVYTDKEPRAEKRLHKIVSFVFGSYNKHAPAPRDYAETIPDDIPLLFVASLCDGLVPPQSSMYLYNRLRERGHKKVHLLVLKKAWHPCYMLDNAEDKKTYETVVHAFYRHYNVPYNAALADAGQKAFEHTQPKHVDIAKDYHLPTCAACFHS